MDYTEKNKTIAIFMDSEDKLKDSMEYGYFHLQWDWLMPVVEKIESIEDPHHGYFGVHISSNSCTIQGTNFRSDIILDPPIYFHNAVLGSKLLATHYVVVKFIEWYTIELYKKELQAEKGRYE
jgi:hypothetical protein